MKHTIEHSCGHPAEHDLPGSPAHQQWEAKRRAGGPCPICWKAGVDSENALNAAFAAEQALPPLAGTERQVAWAVSIRAEFLAVLPERMAALAKLVDERSGARLSRRDDALVMLYELVCVETSAPWWIRNRFKLAAALIQRNQNRLRMSDTGETARRLLTWIGVQ